MEFKKYELWGSYHWDIYKQGSIYTKHADKVKEWIKEDNVLDIGCGDGLITHLLGAKGIDDNELAIKLAKEKGVDAETGDIYALQGSYKAVYLGDVLEHLERPKEALKQVSQVTDTLYLVTPPRKGKLRPHHFYEWTPEELTEFMKGCGWEQVGELEVANHRMYGKYRSSI